MPRSNLRPTRIHGLSRPLHAHREKGSGASGNLVVDDITYIDWFIRNDGPRPVTERFFTDLYLDGVLVERWTSAKLDPEVTVGVSDWDGLTDRFNLVPGEHTLKLVVDATDLVAETNEQDNVFEHTFTWGGTPPERPEYRKRPNITPALRQGTPALTASSDPEADGSGRLTVDGPTYITLAIENVGLASTDQDVLADLYFDGMFVRRVVWSGMLAGQIGHGTTWDQLAQTVRLAPGSHMLRLDVDPTNLIDESDETDNSYEIELSWGAGAPPDAVPTPTPDPEAPLPIRDIELPNLAPDWPFGWDAPVVAKAYDAADSAQEGFDGPLSVLEPAYVSFALRNASPIAVDSSFNVELFVDGERIAAQSSFAGHGGWWANTVVLPAGSVPAGRHTVRLVIDSGDAIPETDETDNVFERRFEWLSGPLPAPAPPVAHTEDELRGLLSALPDLLLVTRDLRGPDAADQDWTPVVLDAAEAAYYLVTGLSLADEWLIIEILPSDRYDARHLGVCLNIHARTGAEEYPQALLRCKDIGDSSAGLTTNADGRVLVLVREERSPASALSVLFHELGHVRARLSAPTRQVTTESNPALDGLNEAQAQVFEAVAWRHLAEFLGADFSSYPDFGNMRREVAFFMDRRLDNAASGEQHALGYLLMWLAVLSDEGGLGLAAELRARGELSATSTLALFAHLLSIPPRTVPQWIDELRADEDPLIAEYRVIAAGRLVEGLSPDDEGHPDLREVAFLAP